MIEEIIKEYLSNSTEITQPVYLEHPQNPPEEYFIIEKTSTSRENFVETATFAIQSYASSLFKSCQMNEKVKKTMDDAILLKEIAGVHLISDYNYTDTTTKKYRYQAVFQLSVWEG